MSFSTDERKALLALKGVGPTVIARLEQLGYESFAHLQQATVTSIVIAAADLVGSSCWKNSPQARATVAAVISLAQARQR